MNRGYWNWVRGLRWALALVWLGIAVGPVAGDSLIWRKDSNRVEADVQSWNLQRLLAELAAVTDWEIYVEPTANRQISTKFRDRTTGEALKLLLGDLNFALVPQTNRISRLYVFRTSPQEATRRIQAPPKAQPIPNELIVTLKPGGDIDALARELGAKVVGRVDALNLYRLEFADEAAAAAAREKLENHEQVAAVDANYRVNRSPQPEALAYGSSPGFNLKARSVGAGDQVIVGLIDTGVTPANSPHRDLLLPGISLNGDGAAGSQETGTGNLSHGDSMLQAVLRGLSGVLEGNDGTRVRVLPVDIYSGRATATSFEVARGVYLAVQGGASVINMSLSSNGEMPYLQPLIQQASQQGVVFLAAAGNEPTTAPSFPAAYPEVIAVTAGTSSGEIAAYANRGDFVDAIAPGSIIARDSQGAAYLVSGTSVSTAFAAGMAAGLADRSGADPKGIEAFIRRSLAPVAGKP